LEKRWDFPMDEGKLFEERGRNHGIHGILGRKMAVTQDF
jgi:hypothetical protein